MTHKGVQTTKSVSLIASEKLQKHIEESSVKIEAACAQMGAVCTKLKLEKSELESSLNAEKQMVEKLREQLATHQQNATIRVIFLENRPLLIPMSNNVLLAGRRIAEETDRSGEREAGARGGNKEAERPDG